jgi:amino acid transporter
MVDIETSAQLKRNQIGFWGALFISLGFMAPAMSLFFTTPAMVGSAGSKAPLAYLVATIGILCTGNALACFGRRYPTTGSFVTYISKGLGGRVGLVSAVILLVGYTLAASTVVDIFGSWTHDVLVRFFSISIPWQVLAVGMAFVLTLSAIRGLKLSIVATIVLFVFEILLVMVVSVAIIMKGGANGLTAEPFVPTGGTLQTGFGLAAILAVYAYLGYEGAVTLGEETKNSRRNTPLAVISAILILGGFYVFASYSSIIGYGVGHMKEFAGDSALFYTLSERYLPGSEILIGIAGITSTLACGLALLNVQPRIFYNIGRAKLFPTSLSRVHRTFGTPYVAIITFGILITTIPLIASISGMDPLTIFGVIGTYGSLPITVIYMMINVALIRSWLKSGRDGSPLTHLVIPVIGTLIWIWPLYLTIKPGGGYFNWTWLAVIVHLIAGIALLAVQTRRGRDLGLLASVIAGEEELD